MLQFRAGFVAISKYAPAIVATGMMNRIDREEALRPAILVCKVDPESVVLRSINRVMRTSNSNYDVFCLLLLPGVAREP
jgi:hypothetical protein